ncbi:hypothetical protein MnBA_28180 [Marinobacterium sp. BA1]
MASEIAGDAYITHLVRLSAAWTHFVQPEVLYLFGEAGTHVTYPWSLSWPAQDWPMTVKMDQVAILIEIA